MTRFEPSPEEVVRQYADMVYRLAYAILRSAADADDVFQDVFLRYTEKAPRFASEEHRKAWLLRVTINRCRSIFRTYRRFLPLQDSQIAPTVPESSGLNVALARLSKPYRTVIHLFYFENYSTEEIARITAQRPSTVRTQLTRARAQLREALKGDYHDL